MNFGDAIKSGFSKYVVFEGRSRRSEFWFWFLFVYAVAGLLVLFSSTDITGFIFSTLYGLFAIAIFLPSLAMQVRRLHDTDRSGWFILLALIPLVGAIILLVFYVQEGTPGDNRFGANPKA